MMPTISKTLILIATGLFLYSRVLNNSILFYINQRFITLTVAAAIGFIIVAVSYYRRAMHDHDHDHGDHGDHEHGNLTWLGWLIVAIPVIFGLLVQPQPLGAAAVGNREINISSVTSVTAPQSQGRINLQVGEKTIVDWLVEFQRREPTQFNGEKAIVTGFVYRDERFGDERFLVARFILSCCVADASPVGLVVQWPESLELPQDQWVEVRGHFEVGLFEGLEIPILIADEVKPIPAPSNPYLYG
ncbi:MAG: TIGR03943 family protein [Anaerolineae bacterium]|nr:TIGR03943 family protein [Anaerolineae bacterium]